MKNHISTCQRWRWPTGSTGWLQQQMTAVGQVYYILHCRDVLRILAQVEKLAQKEMRREADIIF